jgi:hypothetical protein
MYFDLLAILGMGLIIFVLFLFLFLLLFSELRLSMFIGCREGPSPMRWTF